MPCVGASCRSAHYTVSPTALKHKSLLMLFDKPSLRTRVSLEAGMTQLGGHSIAYMTGDSPIGAKESYEVGSGRLNVAMARIVHLYGK